MTDPEILLYPHVGCSYARLSLLNRDTKHDMSEEQLRGAGQKDQHDNETWGQLFGKELSQD